MNTENGAEDSAGTDGRLFLPMSEVARRLGCSRSTVVRACDDGELPVVTFRGVRRVPAAFIDFVVATATGGASLAIEQLAAEWKARSASQPEAVACALP